MESRTFFSITVGVVFGTLNVRVESKPVDQDEFINVAVEESKDGLVLAVYDRGVLISTTPKSLVRDILVVGGPRNDVISIDPVLIDLPTWLRGGMGNDFITGGRGRDLIDGGSGNDDLYGNDGDDDLRGGDDNDIMDGGLGADIMSGGDNRTAFLQSGVRRGDYVSYASRTDPTRGVVGSLDGANNDGYADEHDTIMRDVEGIRGSAGDDTLISGTNAEVNVLEGNGGDDLLIGGLPASFLSSQDYLIGDSVELKTLVGQAGDDTILAIKRAQVFGDFYRDFQSDFPRPVPDDGGNDFIQLAPTSHSYVEGGAGDDRIISRSTRQSILNGSQGNDTIDGGPGDDFIYGGPDDDTLRGNGGGDGLGGGAGNDNLNGGTGNDYLGGEAGDDILTGGVGNDNLEGAEGDDTLSGGVGNDELYGDDGSDVIIGGEGGDQMFGGPGDDFLYARDGIWNERVDGGSGNDYGLGDRDAFGFVRDSFFSIEFSG